MPAPEPDELQGARYVAHLVVQKRARPRFDMDLIVGSVQLKRIEGFER